MSMFSYFPLDLESYPVTFPLFRAGPPVGTYLGEFEP